MSPEERQVRLKKADSIRKMLADQSAPSASTSGKKFVLARKFKVRNFYLFVYFRKS